MAEDFGPNGALQGIVSTNYSLPRDEQGNLTIPSQAAADYLNAEPKLEAHDKSLQQEAVDWAADKMIALGVDPYAAYKYSRNILGDANSADPDNMGIGLTDVTPLGAWFALNQAKRNYRDAGKKLEAGDKLGGAIDTVFATGDAALSVAESFPFAKVALAPLAGPARNFLRSLKVKLHSSSNELAKESF